MYSTISKIALTVQTSAPGFDVGQGRYFPLGRVSQQVYALLWDPWMLAFCDKPPVTRGPNEPIDDPSHTLLLYTNPTQASDIDAAQTVIAAGGHVIFNRPEPEVFESIAVLHDLGRPPASITSLCERWNLGEYASRDYYYKARERFYRIDVPSECALSYIGDNPDLVVLPHAGIFTGDPFAVMDHYWHFPKREALLLDLATLLGDAMGRLIHGGVMRGDDGLSHEHAGLRRDFHAFGFAYQTVLEYARCLGRQADAMNQAARAAAITIQAARTLRQGDTSRARKQLAEACAQLGTCYQTLEPHPATFVDTLHGGGLLDGIGYFEFDWPQHTADTLRRYLRLTQDTDYRVNLDFAATSWRYMAERFPRLIEELRQAADDGRIELVNGTLNQPYPPLHSLDSQLRQYDMGLEIYERLFGRQPKILASQEFAFSSQTPAILAQYGYRGAVMRVQHFADTPTINEPFIDWASPDGRSVLTIPSHGDKSERRNELTYDNLHLKIYAARQEGIRPSVFSCMGDVTFYRPMREELARVCQHMPALGRFACWNQCFDDMPVDTPSNTLANTPAIRQFTMDDFQTDRLVMMDPRYPSSAMSGNFIEHGLRSMSASHLFMAADMIDAMLGDGMMDRSEYWEDLLNHQGHDTYIVPNYPAGGFMGGVNDPDSRHAGHAMPTVAEYQGTWHDQTIRETTAARLAQSEQVARQLIKNRLRDRVSAQTGSACWAIYNPSAARVVVVRLPDTDQQVRLNLPAWSVTTLADGDVAGVVDDDVNRPGVEPSVAVDSDSWTLQNSLVSATFDPLTGQLLQFMRCNDGSAIVRSGGHRFVVAGKDEAGCEQVCHNARIVAHGPMQAVLEFDIELRQANLVMARLLSRVTMNVDEPLLRFETTVAQADENNRDLPVMTVLSLQGDQWENHLGVCFDVPDDDAIWERGHFNVLEPTNHHRLFSPNLLLARGERIDTTFINFGNAIYKRDGSQICQLMIYENEPTRCFEYMVGVADDQPVIQARAAVQPVYVERIVPSSHSQTSVTDVMVFNRPWVDIDHPAIELISCARVADGIRYRLANTRSRPVHTSIRVVGYSETAYLTDFLGRSRTPVDVGHGRYDIQFASCEIVELHIPTSKHEKHKKKETHENTER